MHLTIPASDICIRLFCAVLTGILIGWDRSRHGLAAGLRTMMLVSLAACVSMIQVNMLLPLTGKAHDSFIVMDLMRLPLGTLSGMGFIGAGTVLRRDNFVIGVTTAAAMWFVTVLGLCSGGGQIVLGMGQGGPEKKTFAICSKRTDRIESVAINAHHAGGDRELGFDLQWRAREDQTRIPRAIDGLTERSGVIRVAWNPLVQ